MPYLTSMRCPACGDRHDFCADGIPHESKRYAFTCPKAVIDTVVAFPVDSQWGKFVPACPRDSVRVVEVGT